jgi:RNA-directed DNA polymerase
MHKAAVKSGSLPSGYALNQSPFFKLESKDRLADLLWTSKENLQRLAASDKNYKQFLLPEKRDITGKITKARWVQKPIAAVAPIHKRIQKLLARIEAPNYLHSAVMGRSYISNARVHAVDLPSLKVDIRGFYPATKRHHIYTLFRDGFACGEDASALLARLCTCHGVLPTGSSLSTHISFYAHCGMFEELSRLAETRGYKFTVYVDDFVFTGEGVTRSFLREIESIVNKHQLSVRLDKSRLYKRSESKLITGVIVESTTLRVPNGRFHKLRLLESKLARSGANDRIKLLNKIVGLLGEASQIEPRFKHRLAQRVSELRLAQLGMRTAAGLVESNETAHCLQ